ncbi:MAG: zinc ribbon domain-containing protein [Methanomassiliicoccales archaeon]|jgi:cytochrome bd-type quinol oxidase subunit 2|nr:zinc ribbon domain-containing protein [Methanomassiliicoccales archaeon]
MSAIKLARPAAFLMLSLMIGAILLAPGAQAATWTNTETRTVGFDRFEVVMLYEAESDAQVTFAFSVELGTAVDLLVMGQADYSAYEVGAPFSYIAGSVLDGMSGSGVCLTPVVGERYYVVLDNTDRPAGGADPTGSVRVQYTVTALNASVPGELYNFLLALAVGGVVFIVAAILILYLIFFRKRRAPVVQVVVGKCPDCGAEVPPGSQYCPRCGKRF